MRRGKGEALCEEAAWSITCAVHVLLLAAGPSVAGLAHVGSRLICSDCHTMHYSMQHNYRGGPQTL